MATRMTINTSEFDRQINIYATVVIPNGSKAGMKKAVLALMEDAVIEEPTAPVRDKYLRGSGSAFVQNELVGHSKYGVIAPDNKGRPATQHVEPIQDGQTIGVVGFNRRYAALWHETEPEGGFRVAGCGKKYLESKLARNADKYTGLIAGEIRTAHKGGVR